VYTKDFFVIRVISVGLIFTLVPARDVQCFGLFHRLNRSIELNKKYYTVKLINCSNQVLLKYGVEQFLAFVLYFIAR
jgi:hypothetical protein